MLIQLLNIAGIGPVIGVILGIKFGLITFLIIPLGCVLMGSVHDFVSGMMSLRNRGANLPVLVEKYLGSLFGKIFSFVMVGILLLVVAVFINVPANLVNIQFIPNNSVASLWMVIGVIFVYYVIATLFPMDKIIGRIYPVFGAMLLCAAPQNLDNLKMYFKHTQSTQEKTNEKDLQQSIQKQSGIRGTSRR